SLWDCRPQKLEPLGCQAGTTCDWAYQRARWSGSGDRRRNDVPKLSPRAATLLAAAGLAATAASISAATPAAHSSFAPTRTLRLDVPVEGLAANGSHSAFVWGGNSVDVWDVRTGVRRNVDASDDGFSDLSITDDV